MDNTKPKYQYAADYPNMVIQVVPKKGLRVIPYSPGDTDEDFNLQLEEVRAKVAEYHKKYYSSDAVAERILNRGLIDIIKDICASRRKRRD